MTAAAEAYAAAQAKIAEARASGWTVLRFDSETFRALNTLPPDIADLSHLEVLNLDKTSVSDLSALSGLTGLTHLYLSNTFVSDLSALSGLIGLQWLYLGNTPVSDLSALSGLISLQLLHLRGTSVTDLSALSGLRSLRKLFLENTSVSDLSALYPLSDLSTLNLDNTPVEDLRPTRTLVRLSDHSELFGLTFRGCAAAKADPRIAEIAEIGGKRERARALFAYLENWTPPSAAVPEGDGLLPVEVEGVRLEIALSTPSEAERDERLKRVLHERLRSRAADLERLAGNTYVILAAKARAVRDRLDRNFEDVDLLSVHLDIGELNRLAVRGAERDGDPAFPTDLADALADVVQDGPGLTLDNADVELLEERKARLQPRNAEAQDVHNRLAAVLAARDDAVGDNLRALERRTLDTPGTPDTQVLQDSAHRNAIIRIGRWVLAAVLAGGGAVAGAVATDLVKEPILALIKDTAPLLLDMAKVYGSDFLSWFQSVLAKLGGLVS